MWLWNTLVSVFTNTCPRCHKGKVFTERNPYRFGKFFSMHKSCSCCSLTYEREVSFFYGAMYISYGLMVGWFGFWYILELLFIKIDLFYFMILLALSILALSPVNLRVSRLVWLNIFFGFDKRYRS